MLDSPDILCMLRWNRKVLNIGRCQVREPTLDDMTDFIEEETILMKESKFSREALADYDTTVRTSS